MYRFGRKVCPKELDYWRENTSIGFVFSLLTSMSFIVGVILVYQTYIRMWQNTGRNMPR